MTMISLRINNNTLIQQSGAFGVKNYITELLITTKGWHTYLFEDLTARSFHEAL